MAEYTQVPSNNFIGGLLTERGELTFPENASVDELNCDLLKTGSRRRRLGIAIEAGSAPTTETIGANTTITTHKWNNVAEQADVDFTVLQVGATLMFFDNSDGSAALSANRVDTTFASGVEYALDMSTFQRPTGSGAGAAAIQVASIKGALVVSSAELNTFYITRDTTTGAFTETEISFRVRDFEWQGDITAYAEEGSATSLGDGGAGRVYDTKNAGWSDGPNNVGASALSSYRSGSSDAYPPLTHPWYSGKNSSGAFSLTDWNEIYAGSTLIVNGHYILDLYSKDRQSAAARSVTEILAQSFLPFNTTESSRFSAVSSYAGRVWYSGMNDSTDDNGNKIFFSQILEDGLTKAGELMQVNDPTSENLSDLLDTDGGFIVIPEAHQIRKLHPFGPYLFAFASNGVWRIGGVDDVFRATDYTISKVSEDGIVTPNSFISAQGQPYWWSNNGIFRLGQTEGGGLQAQNVSISSIQTFWENIDGSAREDVTGFYDESTRRVGWIYANAAETEAGKRNNILFWDEVLEAWFPWKVSDEAADTDYIVDATYVTGVGATSTTQNVITNGGDLVVTSAADQVTATATGRSTASSKAKFLVVDGSTGKFTFAEFTETAFADWGSADYSSYAEAAYSFMGDMETRKSSPFITVFMKDTATGFTLEGASTYTVDRDSGLLVSSYFDFSNTPSTVAQQAFRRKSPVAVDAADLATWNYPRTVIATRLKLRGRGRSMRLRFESEAGKDFHLLGYNVIISRPGRF